jgi:hypothetical protein
MQILENIYSEPKMPIKQREHARNWYYALPLDTNWTEDVLGEADEATKVESYNFKGII